MAQTQAQAHITKSEAMVLMKNMLRISVSSICYFRDIFPKACFKNKDYGTVPIHQLQGARKEDDGTIVVENEEAFLLTQWLEKGVFQALEKEFLHSMTFAIYTKHPISGEDLLLEVYEFKMGYTNSGSEEEGGNRVGRPGSKRGLTAAPMVNGVPLFSKESVKQQAGRLIRSLAEFTSTLDGIPDDRWITLQLKYEDGTPREYEPEFFRAAEQSLFSGTEGLPLVIKVGALQTAALEMQLRFAGLESLLFEDLCKIDGQQGQAKQGEAGVLRAARTGDDAGAGISPPGSGAGLVTGLSQMGLIAAPLQPSDRQKNSDALTDYDKVKEHIMSTGRVNAKQVSQAFVMPDIRLKDIFAALVKNGVIKSKGKQFVLSAAGEKERETWLKLVQQKQTGQQKQEKGEEEEEWTPRPVGGARRPSPTPPRAPRKSPGPGVNMGLQLGLDSGTTLLQCSEESKEEKPLEKEQEQKRTETQLHTASTAQGTSKRTRGDELASTALASGTSAVNREAEEEEADEGQQPPLSQVSVLSDFRPPQGISNRSSKRRKYSVIREPISLKRNSSSSSGAACAPARQ